ncbi:hypothetical protein GCM10010260_56120 [Streptomyces filipinensis]|uniref:Uncharacterized protein n=1 Tax=Streptomyces filipinensis TaxID=66887 RepID=A0A918IF99_9ACTN|nr:hypothetical protein GCM10010260_56120 [Streptomyces filipinensis]
MRAQEDTYRTRRGQHASLETHGAVAWFDEDGRLTVRTSSQTPFLTRRALCALYDLPLERVRVMAGRVGGGFGGKQEMLVEDIVALAVLKLRRPVKLEYTRAEQFYGATTRHPFTIQVKAGARRDGVLTALQLRVVANTGAYGNHGPVVMFHSVGESMAIYRAVHKKVDAYSVYTHTVPAGAFRGYGLGQVMFAVESAFDELARRLDLDPLEFKARNVIGADEPMVTPGGHEEDLHIASYGLDQCIGIVRRAQAETDAGLPAPEGWLVGEGAALAMIATGPPGGHIVDATTTVHRQIAAGELGTTVDRIAIRQSDTDVVRHDTGAFASTGTVVAGKATLRASRARRRSSRPVPEGTADPQAEPPIRNAWARGSWPRGAAPWCRRARAERGAARARRRRAGRCARPERTGSRPSRRERPTGPDPSARHRGQEPRAQAHAEHRFRHRTDGRTRGCEGLTRGPPPPG